MNSEVPTITAEQLEALLKRMGLVPFSGLESASVIGVGFIPDDPAAKPQPPIVMKVA